MVVAMATLAGLDAVGKLATQTYPVSQVLFLRFAMFLVFALALAGRAGGIRPMLVGSVGIWHAVQPVAANASCPSWYCFEVRLGPAGTANHLM